MEPAIKKIVDAYLQLGNRRAVEDLLMHRRRLSIDLRARGGGSYDYSRPIAQVEEEILIIAEALQRFDPRPSTVEPASSSRVISDPAA